jgi:membrane protease YdiL (CAAX protease family)
MSQNHALRWSVWIAQLGARLFPQPRNRAVPWGGVEVFVVMMGFIVLPAVLFLVATRIFHLRADDGLVLGVALTAGTLTILSTPLVLWFMCGARPYQLGLHCDGFWRNVILGIVTYCLAAPLVALIMGLSIRSFKPTPHQIEQIIRRSPTPGYFVAATICAVVIAPLQEELVFRGMLLPWLRRFLGARWAIVLSASVFASLHSDAWPAPIPLFVFALFLGYLAHHTNSLLGPITLHAIFNGVSMIMLFVLVHFPEPADSASNQTSTLTDLPVATSILRGRWSREFTPGRTHAQSGIDEPHRYWSSSHRCPNETHG